MSLRHVPNIVRNSYHHVLSCVFMYLLVHSFEQRQFIYFLMYRTSFRLSSCLHLCMHVVTYREDIDLLRAYYSVFHKLYMYFITAFFCYWSTYMENTWFDMRLSCFIHAISTSFLIWTGGHFGLCKVEVSYRYPPKCKIEVPAGRHCPPFEMSSLTCSTTHLRTPEVDGI